MKKLAFFLALAVLFGLCACAAGPETAGENRPAELLSPVRHTEDALREDFSNAEGTIAFHIDVDAPPAVPASAPVLRVRPRVFTAADAERMARAVFGGAAIHEYSREQTKAQVAELIRSWEQAVTDEAIRADHGADLSAEDVERIREQRQDILDYWRRAYEYARADVEPTECLWRFFPAEHYWQYDYVNQDVGYTDDFPRGASYDLMARAEMDGLAYIFTVDNREADDFSNHSVYIYADIGSPEELYDPVDATDEQVAAALARAEAMVQAMDIGEWRLTASAWSVHNEEYGQNIHRCAVQVTGWPVYAGVPMISHPPLGFMRSAASAAGYYPEMLEMMFLNDGRLASLHWDGAMEVTDVTDLAAPVLDWEQVSARGREDMEHWTLAELWPHGDDDPYAWTCGKAAVRAEVDLTELELGFSRIREDGESFLLIPTLAWKGMRHVYYLDNGQETDMAEHAPPYPWEYPGTYLVQDLRTGESVDAVYLTTR